MEQAVAVTENVTSISGPYESTDSGGLYLSTAGEIFYFILLILMTTGGTLGNIMVIAATIAHKILRTPGNLFIINLAFADMAVSLVINCFGIMGNLIGIDYFKDKMQLCFFLGYFCYVVCVASLWTILMISVNRYVALVHHQKYSDIFTWRNSALMCLAVWVAASLAASPPFFGFGGFRYDDKSRLCLFTRDTGVMYNLYTVVLVFGIPLQAIVFFYLNIYLFIRRRKIAMRKMTNKIESAASSGVQKEKEETKLAKTLFIVFLGFAICWTPFAIVVLADSTNSFSTGWYMFIITMAHLSSSGLNFAIYGVTNKQFRDGYKKVLYAMVCKKPGARVTHSTQESSKGGNQTNATNASTVV